MRGSVPVSPMQLWVKRRDICPAELCFDPLYKLRRRARPRAARQLPPMQCQDEGWDAAHVEPAGDGRLLIDIELDEPRPGLDRRRGLLEFRRHHLAGAAPRSPKVDQQWHVAFFEVPFEACGVEHDRMCVEQGLVALSTAAAIRQPFARQAVDRVAMRANDVDSGHLVLLASDAPAVV